MSRKGFVTGAVIVIGAGAMVGADTLNRVKDLGLQTDQAVVFVTGVTSSTSATATASVMYATDLDPLEPRPYRPARLDMLKIGERAALPAKGAPDTPIGFAIAFLRPASI